MRAGAALVVALVAGALAWLVPSVPDVVQAPAPERIPFSTDRDVLGAAAANTLIAVERDPDGQLVMLITTGIDPLTAERAYPAPAAPPAGSRVLSLVGAVLAAAAGGLTAASRARSARAAAALGAGTLGALGVGALLAGSGLLGGFGLACAAVLAVIVVPGSMGRVGPYPDPTITRGGAPPGTAGPPPATPPRPPPGSTDPEPPPP